MAKTPGIYSFKNPSARCLYLIRLIRLLDKGKSNLTADVIERALEEYAVRNGLVEPKNEIIHIIDTKNLGTEEAKQIVETLTEELGNRKVA